MHAPFAGVDPLVRDIWLSNVHEAWSFLRLAQQEPETAAIVMLPLALGLAAAIAAAGCESGAKRLQWSLVAATALAGTLLGLWLIRVLSSVGPIAPLGGVWLMMRINERFVRAGKTRAALWSFLLLLPFASIPWALAIGTHEKDPKVTADDCHASQAFSAFAALPPGLILAPIDAGSHLLAFTSHSVLAAPYHRNNRGNKVALEAFLAPPDESRAIVIASGANYIAICKGLGETSVLGERAPASLAAALAEGHAPAWLVPVSAAHTPYRIFTVRP